MQLNNIGCHVKYYSQKPLLHSNFISNPLLLMKMTVSPSYSSEQEDSFHSLDETEPEAGV